MSALLVRSISCALLLASCRATTSAEPSPAPNSSPLSPIRVGPQEQYDRVAGAQCSPPPPGESRCRAASRGCSSDRDCTEHPQGRCIKDHGWVDPNRYDYHSTSGHTRRKARREHRRAQRAETWCGCEYSCMTDQDCADGELCRCWSDGGGECVEARCRTNDDCPGTACGVSSHFDGCYGRTEYHCRTANDECRGNADCQDGVPCTYDLGLERWTCDQHMGCNF